MTGWVLAHAIMCMVYEPSNSDITAFLLPLVILQIEEAVAFSVIFREEFRVQDHQQLPVTVYDYYEPGINTRVLRLHTCRFIL